MADVKLTAGICKRLNDAQEQAELDALWSSEPTVQILSIKKVGPQTGPTQMDRYRIIVSDGECFLQAMMATQLNHFVEEGHVGKNTVVVIEKFTANYVQDKRSAIVTHKERRDRLIMHFKASHSPPAACCLPEERENRDTSSASDHRTV